MTLKSYVCLRKVVDPLMMKYDDTEIEWIIDELEALAKETEDKAAYLRVRTPHLTKGSLYEKSGHLDHYQDAMYPSMDVDGTEYYVKPMNCPHHHKIYAARPKSYRDLPVR